MAHALAYPQLARRSPLLAFIILMHAAFIYFVNAGLRIEIPLLSEPIQLVDIAPEPVRAKPIRSPAEPAVTNAVPEIPPPEVVPEQLPEPVIAAAPVDSAITDAGAVVDTAPSVDPRHSIGKPPYPPQSIRLGEEGLVRVNICVQENGRLSDVALATSSGYPLLDEAAVKHLRKPGIRFRPAQRAGQPVAMCTTVPIRFDIRNR